jgi:hypothetical protein
MNPPFHPQSICPSANFPSFHLPHTKTHPWGPHPPPVLQENCALPGPTILHWGTHFYICTLLPKLFFIYCTNVIVSSSHITFSSSPLAKFFPFLEKCNPCHPWLGHYLSFILDEIVHIFRVPHRPLISAL